MSRRPTPTISLQSVRSATRSRLPAAVAAVALLAAGCGGSAATTSSTRARPNPAPTSTAAPRSDWTGMGAPLSAFERAHPPVEAQPGYGNGPSYPGPGQCCQFTDLSTAKTPTNRVDGYTQALSIGTSIAAAKLEVLALMPNDTTTTAFLIEHDSSGQTCALWNIQSPTLGKWLSTGGVRDPRGVMGIDLNSMNTQHRFSTDNVTQAVISTAATNHSTGC